MKIDVKRVSRYVIASSLSFFVSVAIADEEAKGLEEVIVTATKTGESNLQDIAIAISTISEDQLNASNIATLKDITNLVPSVTIGQNVSYGQLYIRGIGTNNVFTGGDPSSTVHLDGVYLARPVSVFTEFLELERVEVLRGPQGTLYGRNSTGGTVNLITKKPSSDFHAKLSAEVGSFNTRGVKLFTNGEVVDDTLLANIAYANKKSDGYIDNINPAGDDDLANHNKEQFRAMLRWFATEDLMVDVSIDRFEREESPIQYKPTGLNQQGIIPAAVPQEISDFWTLNVPYSPLADEASKGLHINATYRLNDWSELSLLSAYREANTIVEVDTDFSELPILNTYLNQEQDQLSHEFQYKVRRDNVSAVAGIYYFEESDATFSVLSLGALSRTIDVKTDNDNISLFTDVSWRINDAWSLLAGLRWSTEEKDYRGSAVGLAPFSIVDKESWSNVSPKLGFEYQVDENIMIYNTITESYKSGGYNFSSGQQEFDSEEVTAYEAGLKVDIPDIRMRINAAAFYYDYRDLQVTQFVQVGVLDISNAAEAEVKGFEVELSQNITNEWRWFYALTYLDAKYGEGYTAQARDNATASNIIEDAEGNRLNQAPEWAIALATDYWHYLPKLGSLLYRMEYKWQDTVYFTPFNSSVSSQDAYGLLNASMTYGSLDNSWQLQLFGENLTDEEYSNASQEFSPTGVNLSINEPRSFGLKFTYHYD